MTFIYILGGIMGFIFLMGFGSHLANQFMFSVLWRRFGYRPEMYNADVLKKTVEVAAQNAMETEAAHAQAAGNPFSATQRTQVTIRYEQIFKPAIELYITQFHEEVMMGKIKAHNVASVARTQPPEEVQP